MGHLCEDLGSTGGGHHPAPRVQGHPNGRAGRSHEIVRCCPADLSAVVGMCL